MVRAYILSLYLILDLIFIREFISIVYANSILDRTDFKQLQHNNGIKKTTIQNTKTKTDPSTRS